ncbi:MAG: hypothetical protein NVS1B13_25680 [Flavisolibacter sp.]
MKFLIPSVLFGVAIGGLAYYFKDDKVVKKMAGKLKVAASEELKKVNWTKIGTQALMAMAQEFKQSSNSPYSGSEKFQKYR